ncbi:hypothetical protein DLAC_06315 [Tieghemostelium lacteum]|uniref:Uncharacterized protein n=1 Tax=Tieghemostelium lacteum TaxID=361077 RepID=A0A151ZEG2_TIELA|nr:hypothetical protein DLAC_06315 [Tieghemostelium lacteum]|eukprot:KYQ92352.1 hypothetical protein DLAC_06315 [Tieghemostelium lacteum]
MIKYILLLIIFCTVIIEGAKNRKQEYQQFRYPTLNGKEKRIEKMEEIRSAERSNLISRLRESVQVEITIGYRIPRGSVKQAKENELLPASKAFVEIDYPNDNIIKYVEPVKQLDMEGRWIAKVQIKGTSKLTLQVYMSGPFAYISNSYSLATVPDDLRTDKNVIIYEIGIDIHSGVRRIQRSIIFEGSALPEGVSMDPRRAIDNPGSDRSLDNRYMLTYCVMSKLAKMTMEKLELTNVGKVKVLVNSRLPTNCVPYDAMIKIGDELMWQPMIMSHEYGHYVQYLAYKSHGVNYIAGGIPGHTICKSISEEQGWSEGYANAFGATIGTLSNLITSKTFHAKDWRNDGTKIFIDSEYYACTNLDLKMETDEGRIMAMIYDLVDSGNDPTEFPDFYKSVPNIYSSQTFNQNWFGNTNFGDTNKDCKFTVKEALVDLLAGGQTNLKSYVQNALNFNSNSNCNKKDYVESIVRYNYGEKSLS